jgi:protein gp37
MAKSKIEWTEVTWNPVTGCSKVSIGCKNCYAETIANRFWGDRKFTDVVCHEDRLEQPLHWKKPRMIFVNSMSDLFHEDVPFGFIHKVFYRMKSTPQHTYQILTKRPERMLAFVIDFVPLLKFEPLKNVWLGVSVENQKTANERIPLLLQTPAAVKWISAEPLLEQIGIREYLTDGGIPSMGKLDWVVVGGESGQNKRPFNPDWARSLRDECKMMQIPFFMKQIDKIIPIPEDLLIREYPKQ